VTDRETNRVKIGLPAMTDSTSSPGSDDEILAQIIREWDHANGQPPDLEDCVRRYPQLKTQIREMHEMRQVVDGSRPETPSSMPQQLGEFRIVRRLETGGMGEVYETWHERLQRRVAIKVLRHGQHSQVAQDRFMREQHVLAHLHQTNIVPIHTAGRDGEIEYFAMPYIDGAALRHVVQTAAELGSTQPERETPSIAELVDLAHKNGTATPTRSSSAIGNGASTVEPAQGHAPVSFKPSMEYLRSVAQVLAVATEAFEHAHDAGILHREVKPPNIVLEARYDPAKVEAREGPVPLRQSFLRRPAKKCGQRAFTLLL
jgi:serine/threonine protein kinase